MKRITLCGSTKFKREFEVINKQLTLEGNVVYSVAFFGHADNIPLTDEQKNKLDEIHFAKIDNSDGIFVIDVDGYIGESTRREIGYAELQGKFVKYLSSFPDLMTICDYATMGASAEKNKATAENIDDKPKRLYDMYGVSQRSGLLKFLESLIKNGYCRELNDNHKNSVIKQHLKNFNCG